MREPLNESLRDCGFPNANIQAEVLEVARRRGGIGSEESAAGLRGRLGNDGAAGNRARTSLRGWSSCGWTTLCEAGGAEIEVMAAAKGWWRGEELAAEELAAAMLEGGGEDPGWRRRAGKEPKIDSRSWGRQRRARRSE